MNAWCNIEAVLRTAVSVWLGLEYFRSRTLSRQLAVTLKKDLVEGGFAEIHALQEKRDEGIIIIITINIISSRPDRLSQKKASQSHSVLGPSTRHHISPVRVHRTYGKPMQRPWRLSHDLPYES